MQGYAHLAHLKYDCTKLLSKGISNTLKLGKIPVEEEKVCPESIHFFSQIGVVQGALTQGNGFCTMK